MSHRTEKVRVVHDHTCDPSLRHVGVFLNTYTGLKHENRDRIGRKIRDGASGWRWVPITCNVDRDCGFEAYASLEWLEDAITGALNEVQS